ncbi:hypothetical protein OG203_16950 [Nocardia sp. NBC_01499]|uniref:hypothetical protein n=1 Tax=Nocardia sp. NBC_01499 TaxID=2903597 RepID=UPI00386325EF
MRNHNHKILGAAAGTLVAAFVGVALAAPATAAGPMMPIHPDPIETTLQNCFEKSATYAKFKDCMQAALKEQQNSEPPIEEQ